MASAVFRIQKPRDHISEYEERRYRDNSKDSESKIQEDINKWKEADPVYREIVDGILDPLRDRDNKRGSANTFTLNMTR